jgi:hypothetical protein
VVIFRHSSSRQIDHTCSVLLPILAMLPNLSNAELCFRFGGTLARDDSHSTRLLLSCSTRSLCTYGHGFKFRFHTKFWSILKSLNFIDLGYRFGQKTEISLKSLQEVQIWKIFCFLFEFPLYTTKISKFYAEMWLLWCLPKSL